MRSRSSTPSCASTMTAENGRPELEPGPHLLDRDALHEGGGQRGSGGPAGDLGEPRGAGAGQPQHDVARPGVGGAGHGCATAPVVRTTVRSPARTARTSGTSRRASGTATERVREPGSPSAVVGRLTDRHQREVVAHHLRGGGGVVGPGDEQVDVVAGDQVAGRRPGRGRWRRRGRVRACRGRPAPLRCGRGAGGGRGVPGSRSRRPRRPRPRPARRPTTAGRWPRGPGRRRAARCPRGWGGWQRGTRWTGVCGTGRAATNSTTPATATSRPPTVARLPGRRRRAAMRRSAASGRPRAASSRCGHRGGVPVPS